MVVTDITEETFTIYAEAEEATAEVTEAEATEAVEEQPIDQAAEEVESEEGDGEPEGEEEPLTEEAAGETEDEDGPALPAKQAKSYSPELVEHYAKRFGTTAEAVAENPALQFAIKKAIDSDIFIAQQTAKLESLEAPEEKQEESAEEATAEAPKPPTPEQRKAYLENLDRFAKEVNDPEMVTEYAKAFCKMQGADYDKAVKGGFDPAGFVHEQTKYAVNLVNTILPKLLPAYLGQVVEQIFPGFGGMYEGALQSNTWEDLRASDPSFKSLAAFGTPEHSEAYKAVIKANPWIESMTLTDKAGRPVSRQATLQARYRAVAQIAAGQKVTPETVKAAVEQGKQQANRSNRRVTAGKSMGAGKPTGTIAPQTKTKGQEIMSSYNDANASSFGGLKTKA